MMGSHTDTSVQRTAGRQQAGSFSGDPPQAPVIFFSNFRKRKVFFFFCKDAALCQKAAKQFGAMIRCKRNLSICQ